LGKGRSQIDMAEGFSGGQKESDGERTWQAVAMAATQNVHSKLSSQANKPLPGSALKLPSELLVIGEGFCRL
jgi:hypothetical protein